MSKLTNFAFGAAAATAATFGMAADADAGCSNPRGCPQQAGTTINNDVTVAPTIGNHVGVSNDVDQTQKQNQHQTQGQHQTATGGQGGTGIGIGGTGGSSKVDVDSRNTNTNTLNNNTTATGGTAVSGSNSDSSATSNSVSQGGSSTSISRSGDSSSVSRGGDSSSVSRGGDSSTTNSGNSNVSISNPRQVGNAPAVLVSPGGECGKGVGVSLGTLSFTGGASFSWQDTTCMSFKAAAHLLNASVADIKGGAQLKVLAVATYANLSGEIRQAMRDTERAMATCSHAFLDANPVLAAKPGFACEKREEVRHTAQFVHPRTARHTARIEQPEKIQAPKGCKVVEALMCPAKTAPGYTLKLQ